MHPNRRKNLVVFLAILMGWSVSAFAQPAINQSVIPQVIQGKSGTNAQRIPAAFWVNLTGLNPNSTYRYFNQVVRSSDTQTSNGAGNVIFANPAGFVRSTSPGMSSAGSYGEFTTDGSGSSGLWLISEPTGNARFTPGNYVFFRIMLNDGNGGTSVTTRLTTSDSVRVLTFGTTNDDSSGTGLLGHTMAAARDFVLLYDNTAGNGRPLCVTFLESDGSDNSTSNNYAAFYADSVNANEGLFGVIIPNHNGNGIRRVERRSTDNGVVSNSQSASGIWPSGAITVNPAGGATPVALTSQDVPLRSGLNLPPTIAAVTRNPSSPQALDPVNVSADVTDLDGFITTATLYYNSGSGYVAVTMADDGLHGDGGAGDDRYGASIPGQSSGILVRYYLTASDNSGGAIQLPADAPASTMSYQVGRPVPRLVINEFMAQNTATIQDPTGEWADWLELFNFGADTVRLVGFGLTDDYATPYQWLFPDTFIAAGSYLLIWCDEDLGDPGLHANFKLSTGGEQIELSDRADYGASVLDSITFGQQSPDISLARVCDGSRDWVLQTAPSPNSSNGLCRPAEVTLSRIGDDVSLTWNASPGASSYLIYRLLNADDPLAAGTVVATVPGTSATLAGEFAVNPRAYYVVFAQKP